MYSEDYEPITLTGDGSDGFPSEREFSEQMEDYLQGLNPKKRAKALMTQDMYSTILSVLLDPNSTSYATAQFRFWSKRMFRLVSTAQANIVTHENRPVAVRDQIYSILVGCHGDASHGGRDKTSAQVRRYYSWIPKELVSRFVKMCPHCIAKRRAQRPFLHDSLLPPVALRGDLSGLAAPIPYPARVNVAFIEDGHEREADYEVGEAQEAYDSRYDYQQPFPSYAIGSTGNGGAYVDYRVLGGMPAFDSSPHSGSIREYYYEELSGQHPGPGHDVGEEQLEYATHEQGDLQVLDDHEQGWAPPPPAPALQRAYHVTNSVTYALPPPISYSEPVCAENEWAPNAADAEHDDGFEHHESLQPEPDHLDSVSQHQIFVHDTSFGSANHEGLLARRIAARPPPPLDLGRASNLYSVDGVARPNTALPMHLNINLHPHDGLAPRSAPPLNSNFFQHRGGDAHLPSPGPLSACSSTSLASTNSYGSYGSTSSYTSDCNSLASALSSFPLTPNATTTSDGSGSDWHDSGKELVEAIRNLLDAAPVADLPLDSTPDNGTLRSDRERTRTRTISSGTPLAKYGLDAPPRSCERRRASMQPTFGVEEASVECTPRKEEVRYMPY